MKYSEVVKANEVKSLYEKGADIDYILGTYSISYFGFHTADVWRSVFVEYPEVSKKIDEKKLLNDVIGYLDYNNDTKMSEKEKNALFGQVAMNIVSEILRRTESQSESDKFNNYCLSSEEAVNLYKEGGLDFLSKYFKEELLFFISFRKKELFKYSKEYGEEYGLAHYLKDSIDVYNLFVKYFGIAPYNEEDVNNYVSKHRNKE
jgi:hypothetical protein